MGGIHQKMTSKQLSPTKFEGFLLDYTPQLTFSDFALRALFSFEKCVGVVLSIQLFTRSLKWKSCETMAGGRRTILLFLILFLRGKGMYNLHLVCVLKLCWWLEIGTR